MTALEKMRNWLSTFPEHQKLEGFQVDYTDKVPNNGGILPSGLVEISRRADLFGNLTVENRYNFALYYVFYKDPGDDSGAVVNADWVMSLQEWVQEQSLRHLVPPFGDDPGMEIVQAQNGALYETNIEGIATYVVQLSVNFTKEIRSESQWLT